MTQIVSSISGLPIYAPSAAYAPTNSADVSAIASSYAESAASGKLDTTAQVVSATAGDGTYVTSINGMGISGQGGGAQVVTSTGSAQFYSAGWKTGISSINESSIMALSAKTAYYAHDVATTAQVVSATAGDGTYVTSINGMGLSGQGGGGAQVVTSTASANYYDSTASASATGVSGINGSAIIASRIYGPLAQSGTAYSIQTSYWNSKFNKTDIGISVNGSLGSGIFKENEVQLNRGTAGKITLNVGASNAQVIVTSTGGATFSAGYSGSTAPVFYLAFNSANQAQIGVGAHSASALLSGENAFIRLCDSANTGTIYASSISSWDAKLDSSAIECTTASAITAIGGSSIGGGGGGSLPITGTSGDDTANYDAYHVEFTRYDTAGEPDIRTAILSPDSLWMDYTLDGNDHTSMTLNESMLNFTLPDGDRYVDAYSIDTWNSAVDTVSSNSASWGQGGVDSATVSAIASSYAESAVSSVSGNYAQSADVSATVDLVSTQSANWGGSALQLSAGPGVKLEKVGNTLVASTDETVLWSGTYQNTATGSIVLSESWKNFQKIEVYGFNTEGRVPIAGIYYTSPFSGESLMEVVVGTQGFATWGNPATFNVSVSIPCRFTSETAVDIGSAKYVGNWNSNWQAANNLNGRTYISKVVGVNRTAGF